MGKILYIADYVPMVELATRLNDAANQCGDEVVVITPRLSVFWTGKKDGLQVHLVKEAARPDDMPDRFSTLNCEMGIGYLTEKDARTLYSSMLAQGVKLLADSPQEWSAIFCWNGALVSSQAAQTLSEHFGIPILFMEIVNIPGKMIFDPEGSNCDAVVAKNPAILDKYELDDEAFEAWKSDFIERRERTATVPQAKRFRRPNFWFLVDAIGPLFGAAPAFSVNAWNRICNIAKRFWYEPALNRRAAQALPPEPFIFLPLQVSTDTNLIVRSSIDNFHAIERACEIAREKGARLVVKIHPAEREGDFFERLGPFLDLHTDMVSLTSANTVECILKSQCVVTINSTVGFEARIFGKEAITLQPTLYSNWTVRQMAQFSLYYTIPFDMYSTEPATLSAWNEIMKRRFVSL